MRRASIGVKIAGGMAALAVLTAVVGGFSYFTLNNIDGGYTDLLENEVVLAGAALDVDLHLHEMLAAELEYLVSVSEVGVEGSQSVLEHAFEVREELDASAERLASQAAGTEFADEADALVAQVVHYEEVFDQLVTDVAVLGDHDSGLRGELVVLGHGIEEQYVDEFPFEAEKLIVEEERFLVESTEERAEAVRAAAAKLPQSGTITTYLTKVDEVMAAFDARRETLHEAELLMDQFDVASNTLAAHADEAEALESDRMSATAAQAGLMVLVAIAIAVVVAAVVATVISRSISKAARTIVDLAEAVVDEDVAALTSVAESASAGDLTARFELPEREIDVSRKDELGDLARSFQRITGALGAFGTSFNQTLADLGDTVQGIQDVANGVADNSSSVAQTSEETARGASEIATSIGEVAGSATDQAAQSESMLRAVDDIERSIEATMTALQQTSEASDEARLRGEQGRETLAATNQAMNNITESIRLAAGHVTAMGESSRQVEEIVELIREIAEQTNLLALNAAIEAARAGDLGRGFAVVAAEVKALAEESATSTDRVAQVVSQMRRSVEEAVESMDRGLSNVVEGESSVGGVTQAFEVIDTSIVTIGDRVGELGALGEQIAMATTRIRGEADGLSGSAESNSAAAEEVAAGSEESAAVAEELGATSQELSAAAAELQRLVSRFRTS